MLDSGTYTFKRFDYVYMFVLIIYMGQATPETSRMVGDISGNPIPFLIPILLTFILWTKHPISLSDKKLWSIIGIYGIWAVLSLYKYRIFTTAELSFHFFMIYAIIVAYIQDAIYGRRLLPLFEQVMVWFCKATLILWLAYQILPPARDIMSLFPPTPKGTNVLYIYQSNSNSLRNSGCAWEPGRYAIMVVLSIFCNLCENGIKFRGNKKIWWMLASLATTMSTTGFSVTLVLYGLFFLRKINFRSVMVFIVVMVPTVYGISQLDFMGDKITTKLQEAQNTDRFYEGFAWYRYNMQKDRYVASLDRFDATVFEYLNLKEDPILGYSRNFKHSYFYTHLSTNHVLATGFMKVFGMYGIFMGAFFYYILYKSSKKISTEYQLNQSWSLFVTICLLSISYQILSIPIFTAFWFYGLFSPSENSQQD